MNILSHISVLESTELLEIFQGWNCKTETKKQTQNFVTPRITQASHFCHGGMDYSKEQRAFSANNCCFATGRISPPVLNQNTQCRFHKHSVLLRIMSQINPTHKPNTDF
jgi:hypothetical protein